MSEVSQRKGSDPIFPPLRLSPNYVLLALIAEPVGADGCQGHCDEGYDAHIKHKAPANESGSACDLLASHVKLYQALRIW